MQCGGRGALAEERRSALVKVGRQPLRDSYMHRIAAAATCCGYRYVRPSMCASFSAQATLNNSAAQAASSSRWDVPAGCLMAGSMQTNV